MLRKRNVNIYDTSNIMSKLIIHAIVIRVLGGKKGRKKHIVARLRDHVTSISRWPEDLCRCNKISSFE